MADYCLPYNLTTFVPISLLSPPPSLLLPLSSSLFPPPSLLLSLLCQAMDAPQQLAQYYMMVTCKWRLAALLCFLKTHQHQKVMVFFSTCDSVDFHALLFRETEWPQDLDAAIEGAPGISSARCDTSRHVIMCHHMPSYVTTCHHVSCHHMIWCRTVYYT